MGTGLKQVVCLGTEKSTLLNILLHSSHSVEKKTVVKTALKGLDSKDSVEM